MIDVLVDHPLLLVFTVLAAGALLGAVRVRGVSLGPAGALFAGLALSAIDERLAIPELVGSLGLALFTYTIGLASGPAFFASLRSQVGTLGGVALALALAAAAALAVGALWGFDRGTTAGLYAGSLTNTPALAAAREALDDSTAPVVGYSVAYPVGVLAMIAAAALVLRRGRLRPNADDLVLPADLTTTTFVVRTAAGIPVAALGERFSGSVVVGRVERAGSQLVPGAEFTLLAGDLVSVTSPRRLVGDLTAVLGPPAGTQLSDDRSTLDMRRIAVSNRLVTGRSLAELDLHGRFGAVATRVRRGDVDLLAHDDTVVLPGDRLRIVAPRDRIGEISRFLGDSERRIAEIDAVGFMLGIVAGLALGLVEVPMLGGHFSLGTAGGPLVVGLVVGRLERTGPLVWQPPYGANLALRQFGTILFLGTVGSRSGAALVDALSSPDGAKLATAAVAVVAVAAVVTATVGRALLGLGGARLAGTIAAVETQPAVLAFVNEQSDDDRIGTAYAVVFPLAMLLKIVLAQLLTMA